MQLLSTSAEDTFSIGKALGATLRAGDTILLEGDLGTGKSVIARGIASGLGIDRPMPSPTFTLMQPYTGTLPLYHFDLYRLADPDEFYEAGLDEYIGADGVAVIEWAEMAELDPEKCIRIALSRRENLDERNIELAFVGLDGAEAEKALNNWRN